VRHPPHKVPALWSRTKNNDPSAPLLSNSFSRSAGVGRWGDLDATALRSSALPPEAAVFAVSFSCFSNLL
jgi:hypothetical protein